MSSRLPRDAALEKKDRIDEMEKNKTQPTIPHLLEVQQAPTLPYAKAPSPDPNPTT